jgi:dihydroorotase
VNTAICFQLRGTSRQQSRIPASPRAEETCWPVAAAQGKISSLDQRHLEYTPGKFSMKSSAAVLLKGAHVIDPAQGIDGVKDIAIENGKIRPVENLPPDVETIDLKGAYLTPGWIDIHVHVYGTLGVADPDSIGVYQGVTSYVEAGGPGIGTLDEFLALLGSDEIKTTLYAGPYIRPLGILGLNFIESDVRTLTNIPIADWIDFKKAHPGLLRYIKVGAFSGYGYGPTKIGKGLAEVLDLPLYAHIGEHQLQPGNDSAYEI